MAEPSTEVEWTIHAINIHGVFFERWCAKTIAESCNWNVKATNYPVAFPPGNLPQDSEESNLDILAQHKSPDSVLTLLVECKKNNPELINWIFFPKIKADYLVVRELRNEPQSLGGWEPRRYFNRFTHRIEIADEAREVRGDYLTYKRGDKTKTSNKAISDAAYQVALATHALIHFEHHLSERMAERKVSLDQNQHFLPAIVTSAKLHICEFDPWDVDRKTGEIPLDKADLTEVPYLFYEYPLPRHLQMAPTNLIRTAKEGTFDCAYRMHILVISAESLSEVLNILATSSEGILGKFHGPKGEVQA